jgi:predicted MFS family arabinose efflux permease
MNAVLVLFLCSKFGLSDETSGVIYSCFYAGIYVLSLVGGIIADRSQNYKGTIMTGLIIMALGYVILSVPILATAGNISWLLPLTCLALFLIVKKALPQRNDAAIDDFTNVELAFNNLSTEDQDYLLEVYQEEEELIYDNDLNEWKNEESI